MVKCNSWFSIPFKVSSRILSDFLTAVEISGDINLDVLTELPRTGTCNQTGQAELLRHLFVTARQLHLRNNFRCYAPTAKTITESMTICYFCSLCIGLSPLFK